MICCTSRGIAALASVESWAATAEGVAAARAARSTEPEVIRARIVEGRIRLRGTPVDCNTHLFLNERPTQVQSWCLDGWGGGRFTGVRCRWDDARSWFLLGMT